MQGNSRETLERMEAMLRRCRRRIRQAEVSVRLVEGLGFYLKCLLVMAGFFFGLRVVAYVVDESIAITWLHVLFVAGIVGFGVFGRAVSLGIWGRPVYLAAAAERLDLSQSTHNRIATAIALLRSGDDSSFAHAAIGDGFDYLDRLQSQRPHVESAAAPWRRMATYLVVSLALVWGGQRLQPRPVSLRGGDLNATDPSRLAKADSNPLPGTTEATTVTRHRPAVRGGQKPAGEKQTPEDESSKNDPSKRSEPGKESNSEGPAGQNASGKSRTSQSSSNSRSAATGAGVKSKPGKTEPSRNKKPRRTKKQPKPSPEVDQKDKNGGSINARGSSGTGSMRTAQNEWNSEVKARSSDSDDMELEEEPDEEMDRDKQRLGVQPALKNRTSHVSRELSLAMGTDVGSDMLKGRGGPNAQKKSRGTATMIMGVPVPGFVKGRMLRGPTKTTQEEVEPTPRRGDYVLASKLREARPEESPQQRYHPLAAIGVQARDYLVTYHAEHENKQNGAATHE